MIAKLLVLPITLSIARFIPPWQQDTEYYREDHITGLETYYTPEFYAQYDPKTKNYKEYRYDRIYGKDYYWINYDNDVYHSREFKARYDSIDYYTSHNEELWGWFDHMATIAGFSGGICFFIALCVIFAQCIRRRRKRMTAMRTQKRLTELDQVERDMGSSDEDTPAKKPSFWDRCKRKKKRKSNNKIVEDQTELADLNVNNADNQA